MNIKISPEEHQFLEKYFRNKKRIDFKEFPVFKELQKKLSFSNDAYFFESKLFNGYLIALEFNVLRRYFKNFKIYSPVLYLKYLLAKWNWKMRLNGKEELKLLIKCLLFKKLKP